MSGPAHIYRNPYVTPSVYTARRTGHATKLPTRSAIKSLEERKNFAANANELLTHAAANCIAVFEKIVAECKAEHKKFFDNSFYFSDRNNMYPEGSPSDCTVSEPSRCARLSDIFPKFPLYCDNVGSNDVVQGAVGDCFFIGAVSALASCQGQHLNPIGRLIVAHNVAYGIYGVVFFKNGGFEWVIVDDYIAIDDRGRPLYASHTTEELWPMVIEKAYAKVHYCWDAIDGGWTREALADLTGGKEYTMNIGSRGQDSRMTFDQFLKLATNPLVVMGCSVDPYLRETGGYGRAGEASSVNGLFKGHAYSVLGAVKCQDGTGFVRVRNPWGNNAEWRGAYSDFDRAWKENPHHKEELKPEFKDDGAFWMLWTDFKRYFVDLDVCEFYDKSTNVVTQFNKATFNSTSADQVFILQVGKPDGMPNYRDPVSTVVLMGQNDPKCLTNHRLAKNGRYSTMSLTIQPLCREPSSPNNLYEVYCGDAIRTRSVCARQLNEEEDLRPGFYAIRPRLTNTSRSCGYYVRVCGPSNVPLRLWRLDNKEETLVEIGVKTEPRGPAAEHIITINDGKGGNVPGSQPATADDNESKPKPNAEEDVAAVVPKPDDFNYISTDNERIIRGRGPEHIYRQPRLSPKMLAFAKTTVTYSGPTASFIKPMRVRAGHATTVKDQMETAKEKCSYHVQQIVALCKVTQRKFFDKTFYYGDRRSMYPNGSPDDCTVSEPRQCKSLNELYPSYNLFANRSGAGDVVQGNIGDCFFIGAVSALASSTVKDFDPLRRLFAAYDRDLGVYGVVFFKNGSWEWVIIDDLIAVKDNGEPLYAQAKEEELWPMLLEKAYAKIHGCWDTIDGGWGREALADLTGGREYTLDLTRDRMDFAQFKGLVDNAYTVMGCSVNRHLRETGRTGRAGEPDTVYGLIKYHAYSVIDARECSDGTGFIRVRNPWGNNAEWRGPYSDRDAAWTRNPQHTREISPDFGYDGAFWMLWDDFKRYFTDIDVCEFYLPSNEVVNAFGTINRYTSTKVLPENTFIFSIDSNERVIKCSVTMGQDDPKVGPDHYLAKKQQYATLRLSVYRLSRMPTDANDLQRCLSGKVETNPLYTRQVHYDLHLEPGIYSIVPRATDFSRRSVDYYIRALCPQGTTLKLYCLAKPKEVYSTGEVKESYGNNRMQKGVGVLQYLLQNKDYESFHDEYRRMDCGECEPEPPLEGQERCYGLKRPEEPEPMSEYVSDEPSGGGYRVAMFKGRIGAAKTTVAAEEEEGKVCTPRDYYKPRPVHREGYDDDDYEEYTEAPKDDGKGRVGASRRGLRAVRIPAYLESPEERRERSIQRARAKGVPPPGSWEEVKDPKEAKPVVGFDNTEGGLEAALASALEAADPYNRGVLDGRMLEQAFSRVLLQSDVGSKFSEMLAREIATNDGQITPQAFEEVARRALGLPDKHVTQFQ